MARRILGLVAFAALLVYVGFLFTRVPGSFVPIEDQGYIVAAVVLPDGASIQRTEKTGETLRRMMGDHPAIENVFVVTGFDLIGGGNKSSAATLFIITKPWEKRSVSTQQLAQEVSGKGFMLPDGISFAFNPPPIRGLAPRADSKSTFKAALKPIR